MWYEKKKCENKNDKCITSALINNSLSKFFQDKNRQLPIADRHLHDLHFQIRIK